MTATVYPLRSVRPPSLDAMVQLVDNIEPVEIER